MKIISFIIPSYNSREYLDKCLTSFIDEKVIDKIEVLIVNDGSTDDTAKIAEKYCRIYPDSFILISQENRGHGGAINTGCAVAKGKYLKVIDADDSIETVNLASFVNLLNECESDIVLTHHITTDIVTGEVKRWKNYPRVFGAPITLSQIMADWNSFERSFTFHGITYKKEFYEKYRHKLCEKVFYEDHEFSTFPACFAETVTAFDLFIYNYRIGDVNQSVSDNARLLRLNDMKTVLGKHISEYKRASDNVDNFDVGFVTVKTKILLMSYLKTVLLIENNKKSGRCKAKEIMAYIKNEMPGVYSIASKQYKVFLLLNYLRISKITFDKMITSKVYLKLKGARDF